MIIKSMSRKHPSFNQIIDYIEKERTHKSRDFSIYHNTYSRDSDHLKSEFTENANHLKFRKNGVYLYHEIISITRTQNIPEDQQKAILKNIVTEYLKMRAKNNLAYAVLHEDKKDNLHFHILISANEAEDDTRKRLSKATFADIQIQLEKWVLETHPELEQKAVFFQNQTDQERQAREQKAHISNKGAELKRRTGHTSTRDQLKTTLENLFETATDGRHFTELLEKEGLTLYQRGKQHGIIDQNGIKYRFSRLGLAEEWEALDRRMMENLQHQKTAQASDKPEQARPEPQQQQERPTMKPETPTDEQQTATGTSPIGAVKELLLHPLDNPIQREMQDEQQRRLEEAKAMRTAKANNEASTGQRNSNKSQQ